MSTEKQIRAGKVLIAQPFMEDPQFKQSVIVICEHTQDGSLGFVLNKPLKMNVNELVSEFPEQEFELYFGGPVATDTIHYIHNSRDLLEDSQEISKGVFWGGDFEKLKFLIRSELIKPGDIKFFVGYSGWSSGQLEDELKGNSWFMGEMDANYAFNSHSYSLWKKVLQVKGDTFSVIAQMNEGFSKN